MRSEVMTITPEVARSILENNNTKNRPINARHVERLAKEMRDGTWKLNGDTICIGKNMLIDGQHRLSAVVASGRSIQSLVVKDLPEDVFDTKDIGKKRSPGDTLGILGEKNAHRLAAALILIDKYMTGRMELSVSYSNTAMESLLKKYPTARDSIQTSHKTGGIIVASIIDACHYLFSQKDEELANEFVEKITRGIGLIEGSPWYVLRERLLANSLSKAKLSRPHVMAMCVKAWNAARSNSRIKKLKWLEDEPFPIVK